MAKNKCPALSPDSPGSFIYKNESSQLFIEPIEHHCACKHAELKHLKANPLLLIMQYFFRALGHTYVITFVAVTQRVTFCLDGLLISTDVQIINKLSSDTLFTPI